MSWTHNAESNERGGAEDSAGPAKILQVLWRHKYLVILGSLVGLVLGGVYYVRTPPVYQTSTQVMVIRKSSSSLMSRSNAQMVVIQDYLPSHITALKSPLIVKEAVKRHDLRELSSFSGVNDPTGAVLRSLSVERDESSGDPKSSNVINLTFRGPVAEDCPYVLNAIVESYENFLDQTFRDVSSQVQKIVEKYQAKYETEFDKAKKAYNDLREKNLEYIVEMPTNSSGSFFQLEQMNNDLQKLKTSTFELTKLEITYERILQAEKDGKTVSEQLALVPYQFKEKEDFSSLDLKRRKTLIPLEANLKLAKDLWGEKHEKVVKARTALEVAKASFQAELDIALGKDGVSLDEGHQAQLRLKVKQSLEAIKSQINTVETLVKAYTKSLDKNRGKVQRLTRLWWETERLREDMKYKEAMRKLYAEKIKDFDFGGSGQDGFEARTLAEPSIGGKVAPRLMQTLLAGLALGLVSGVGLGYLAELTDKGFRTPEEIRRQLGLPVIGHVPVLKADPEAQAKANAGEKVIDPYLVCYYNPKSVEAEAYRAVRTSLYFSTQGSGHNLIQITSPNMGDGKSTLSTNLSVSIAQSGKKIVLIDADLRRPRLHKIFGVQNKIGLSSLIHGEATFAEAVQESAIPNLSLLTCGPMPPNPSELLTSPNFPKVLNDLRDHYEFVIVDTPPLLVVTDPSVVAPRVDGVIMTLRLSKKAGPLASRATEILAGLGANVVGVVVNGLSRHGTSGQYGGGYYSNYGYEYEPDETEESYYETEEGKGPDSAAPSVSEPQATRMSEKAIGGGPVPPKDSGE
ncbi:MAG: polysaccharide biosynthesis tyrosine autokinase [Gemmataceae bacterium]